MTDSQTTVSTLVIKKPRIFGAFIVDLEAKG
jgi:hypothetical protein